LKAQMSKVGFRRGVEKSILQSWNIRDRLTS
jgi:hypothetical protein